MGGPHGFQRARCGVEHWTVRKRKTRYCIRPRHLLATRKSGTKWRTSIVRASWWSRCCVGLVTWFEVARCVIDWASEQLAEERAAEARSGRQPGELGLGDSCSVRRQGPREGPSSQDAARARLSSEVLEVDERREVIPRASVRSVFPLDPPLRRLVAQAEGFRPSAASLRHSRMTSGCPTRNHPSCSALPGLRLRPSSSRHRLGRASPPRARLHCVAAG